MNQHDRGEGWGQFRRQSAYGVRVVRLVVVLTVGLLLGSTLARSADTVVFGPQIYTGTGRPVLSRRTFAVVGGGDGYTLRLVNRGVMAALIVLNDRIVLGPLDFVSDSRQNRAERGNERWQPEWDRLQREWRQGEDRGHAVPLIEQAVTLRSGRNDLIVAFISRPGTSFTLEIVKHEADTTPPEITTRIDPPPNASGWNRTPVTVTFVCSDAGSGIATCPDPVQVTTEGARQVVSGKAVDNAGNAASASVTLNIDQTSPTIGVELSPVPNDLTGWNNTPIRAHFVCADGGSGIVSCPGDQLFDREGVNITATGTATDVAGNTAVAASGSFSIDLTAPTLSVALSGSKNGDVYTGPVTAHFTCADALSDVLTCPADQVVTMAGANQTVSGTATDLALNRGSVTSPPFTIIDSGLPTITSKISPPPNAAGWNQSDVTVSFTCTNATTCSAPVVVTTEGANQAVTGTATGFGGSASTQASVSLDKTPPVFMLTSPTMGATVSTSPLTLMGTVTDAVSGVASVTCNGVPATVTGSNVTCVVLLVPGPNVISVGVADVADNAATLMVTVVLQPTALGPVVRITAPTPLSYFNITPTTVTGTVDDPNATVAVNGIPAVVANGTFSLALPLAEGPNLLTATATTASGVGTASLEVTLDTTPPHVTVTSPQDGFVTSDSAISIAGIVNDIVVGTVNDQQAQVTVNGAAAQVGNRTFLATGVGLSLGQNTIQAVATDRVGNAATTQIKVTRLAPSAQPKIQLTSGNNQFGTIGSVLSAPLIVALMDATNNPVPNAPVIFKVTQNDGMVSADGPPAPTVIATTDTNGRAKVQWSLGMRAGAGGNSVEAYAVGFGGTAVFTATGFQGVPGKIVIDTGNNQVGAIGQPLPKPFIAVVVDNGNNRLGGVPVTFTAQQGGGAFGGQSSVTVNSDSDGRVAAILTLGLQEGNANNLVEASFPSNQGIPAAFTASGRVAGDPAQTSISGVVLDNSDKPIPGVTVRAVLTNSANSNATAVSTAAAVQTDAQGQFALRQAPVGLVKVIADGSTAQLPGAYPSLEYDLVTVAGQNNTVGQPIYLLPLSTANQLCVTPTTGGGTLTIPEAPGFSLTFAPGQVTFPGGSKTGCVGVTVVHGDKVPMMPGFGQQPRFIVTIQPAGAMFNPPAPITLPNVDSLKAREVTEMYSFDHDIGSFVAIGTGVVSDDGQVIRSSQGVGVLKAGWHCGGNATSTGTAAQCGTCQFCALNACQAVTGPDPVNAGQCCIGGQQLSNQPADVNALLNSCPQRTQNSADYFVDGCSIPLWLALQVGGTPNDPVSGLFNKPGTSTAFGKNQGNVPGNNVAPFPCNLHDKNYQTCGKDKLASDAQIRSDMLAVCATAYPSICPYMTAGDCQAFFFERLDCSDKANVIATALAQNLLFIPQTSWEDDQLAHCNCCRP